MRVLLLLLCMFASSAWASAIPVSLPSNLISTATGIATNGAAGLSGGSAAVTMTTQVEGQVVRIPAVMRMAANAGQIGIAAMRTNPWGIVATSVLSMLISYGIQKCADGTWCVSQKPGPAGDSSVDGYQYICHQTSLGNSPMDACNVYAAKIGGQYYSKSIAGSCGGGCYFVQMGDHNDPNNLAQVWSATRTGACASGYVSSSGSCVPDPNLPKVPASDSDWSKVPTTGWPDQVTNDLSAVSGVQLPVTVSPSVDHVDLPLGSPVTDPVTGNRYQTNARVTPNVNDPRTADLTVTKQPVDANGNPATDPATGTAKPPEKPTDQCDGHESRVGCMDAGSVPDPEAIAENKINVSVTPDGGWGPDNGSCPTGTFSVRGFSFSTPWGPVCSFATMIRPLVIAFAWLAAALIVVGIGQKGGE